MLQKPTITDNDYKKYEDKMSTTIINIFEDILKKHDYKFSISVKARGGAEISERLQMEFKEYLDNDLNSSKYPELYNHKIAPSKATKNPFDIAWNFKFQNIEDFIWGDIKTFKSDTEDSNPDLGTPNKIIKFMEDGHFYLCFILFKYTPTETGLVFDLLDNQKHVDFLFLKDAPKDLRINPKPQFQMNIKGKPVYRTRHEFLIWFQKLWHESLDRIALKIPKEKEKINKAFLSLESKILPEEKL